MEISDLDLVQRFFAPAYLDNPVISTGRTRLLLGFLSMYRFRAKLQKVQFDLTIPHREQMFIRSVLAKQERTKTVHPVDPEEYRTFFAQLPTSSEITDQHSRDFVAAIMQIVTEALKTRVPGIELLRRRYEQRATPHIHRWYRLWRMFDDVVLHTNAEFAKGTRIASFETDAFGTVVVSPQYVALLYGVSSRSDLVFTYEQWLMFKDMCASRYQVFCARLWFYDTKPHLDSMIEDQFTWQMNCLERYGNEGYGIAKCTEEVSKAYLSYVSDPIFGKKGPYPRMIAKVREKENKLDASSVPLIDRYTRMLETTTDIETITELFGLQKLCGHPLIDPRKGGLSAAAEARIPDATKYSDACRLRNNFCRIYLAAYITKHGAWPPLEFSGARTSLQSLSDQQQHTLHPNSYPLSDWNTCRFRKHQEFDYHPNFLDLMDDKSISHYRSEKHCTWTPGFQTRSHKRLLREMIAREDISAKDIVDRVMRREVPMDWYIVSLYPKEREFKTAARMFSMLVFEIRLYFALTEANLAESIFPYLPQQTMTKDKISVLRTFGDITKPLSDGPRLRYYLEIDLSRWNLRWRSLSVHMVGDVIDDIFGLRGVYTFVHEFFSECMILVRSPDIRPPGIELDTPPESDTLWYNHHGGFEGITQKLWSACTYSMVDLGLQQFPLNYVLLGQGDNQVVAITLKRDLAKSVQDQCLASRNEIMAVLEDECARTNQEMKPEECLESGSTLTYSKSIYVNGVDYNTVLKAHSRIFPNASSDFPSVMSEIGTVFSTALAGAETTRLPLVSYSIALLHSHAYLSLCLQGKGIYGSYFAGLPLRGLDRREFVRYSLLLPSVLGGLPVPTFAEFLYKGGSDPLSTSVAGVTLLGRVGKPGSIEYRLLRSVQDGSFLNPSPTADALVKDPYGIPIRKPATPVDRVARETLDTLRPHVRNADIKEILAADATAYADILMEHLCALRPMNPLIAHDLFDCSVAGLISTMSTMFTATRTIQGFVKQEGSPIVERLLSQEKLGWNYMVRRFRDLPKTPPDVTKTIYTTAAMLRDGWKKASIPAPVGVTTYHPLDFPVVWGREALSVEGISLLVTPGVSAPATTRGTHDPYLGSKTREKRAEHGYRIVGRDTSSASFRKLQLIMSQIGQNERVRAVIDSIGHSRSNTTLSTISQHLSQVVGGSVSHRYASKVGYLSAHLLGSFTFASNCVISSDNAGFLSGGYVDYPVMMQEYFLTLGSFASTSLSFLPHGERIVTIRIGDAPLVPLPNEQFSLDCEVSLPPFRLTSNKLAFIADLDLVQNKSLYVVAPINSTNLRSNFHRTRGFGRQTCVAWFRAKLRAHNASRMIADSHPSVTGRLFASLDLAETASIGIGRLVDAAAIAIAEEAIYHTWRTAHKRHIRWKIVAFLWKLSQAVSLVLSEHLGHPLLKNDAFLRRHALAVTPLYRHGAHSIRTKLAGLICGRARILIAKHDSALYSTPAAIFTSDNERAASEAAFRLLCLQLHRAWLDNELSSVEGVSLMVDYIIPLGRNKESEAVRIQESQITGYILSHWAATAGKHGLAEHLLAVARGELLQAYPVAVEEVLRDMRNSRLWKLYHKAPDPQLHATVADIPSWREVTMKRLSSWGEKHAGARTFPLSSINPLALLQHQIATSAGKVYGDYSSAHYNFLPCVRAFATKDVVVIGSGQGAIARLALEVGAKSVAGLDLATTIPSHNHNFRWYKPPMVTISELAPRYTQLIQSFITTGDWMDTRVSQDVLNSVPPGATVVIDIQLGASRITSEVLTPLMQARWQGTVVWRFFGTTSEVRQLSGDLTAGHAAFFLYCTAWSSYCSSRTWIFTFKRLPSLLVHTTTEWEVFSTPLEQPTISLEFMGGGRNALMSESVHHLVTANDSPEPSVLFERVCEFFESTKGSYDARPTFSGWTAILEACASAWWLKASPTDRQNALERWSSGQSVTFAGTSGTICVNSSSSLLRHISRVVSRLLS